MVNTSDGIEVVSGEGLGVEPVRPLLALATRNVLEPERDEEDNDSNMAAPPETRPVETDELVLERMKPILKALNQAHRPLATQHGNDKGKGRSAASACSPPPPPPQQQQQQQRQQR